MVAFSVSLASLFAFPFSFLFFSFSFSFFLRGGRENRREEEGTNGGRNCLLFPFLFLFPFFFLFSSFPFFSFSLAHSTRSSHLSISFSRMVVDQNNWALRIQSEDPIERNESRDKARPRKNKRIFFARFPQKIICPKKRPSPRVPPQAVSVSCFSIFVIYR